MSRQQSRRRRHLTFSPQRVNEGLGLPRRDRRRLKLGGLACAAMLLFASQVEAFHNAADLPVQRYFAPAKGVDVSTILVPDRHANRATRDLYLAGPFALKFLRRGASSLADVFDARFGTDAVRAASTGWWTFDRHAGNRDTYVDSINGNDSNDGRTLAAAKLTLDGGSGGWVAFTTGWTSGDRLKLVGKGGRTYTSPVARCTGYGGISLAYPTVFISCDPDGVVADGELLGADMPVVLVGAGDSGNIFHNHSDNVGLGPPDFFVVKGIEVKSSDLTISSTGAGFVGRHDGIGYQNTKWSGVQTGVDISGSPSRTGVPTTIGISKSVFSRQWAAFNGNASGAYFGGCDQIIIEDSAGVHCGWPMWGTRAAAATETATGTPTWLSHWIYIHASNTNTTWRRNIGIDIGGDPFNNRSNCTMSCLVSIDNPSPGAISSWNAGTSSGGPSTLTDAGIMGGCDYNTTMGGGGNGFGATNARLGSAITNLVGLDNPMKAASGGANNLISYSSLDATDSCYLTVTNARSWNYSGYFYNGGHGPGTNVVSTLNSIAEFNNPNENSLVGVNGNSRATAGDFPNYKTRAQIYGALGLTADAITGKAELANILLEYPHLAGQISKAVLTQMMTAVGMTPQTFTAANMPNMSGLPAPRSIY